MSASFKNDPDFNDVVPKSSSGRGSKALQVLTVLGIIVLLSALLLPATRSSRSPREAARRSHCVNNLKQIGLALYNYAQVHNALPPAYTVDANGRPLHSWRTLILPYLEQSALYSTIDLAKSWNDPANAKAIQTSLPFFRCPDAVGPQNTTTYLAIVGPNACLLLKEPRRLAEITDPHESTVMVIEAGEENAVPWMAPGDAGESLVMSLGPSTKLHHPGGMNACFVDGSVRFLKVSTPAVVRRAIMSISGNELLSKEW
jgi:prepilin-type processing-associated H-X9-DG protein